MSNPPRLALAIFLILGLLLSACGGGEEATSADDTPDEVAAGDTSEEAANAPTPDAPAPDAADPAEELPGFPGDFDRVCTTGVGYGGTASYEQVAGSIHPVFLIEEQDSGTLIESSTELPAGWTVTQDDDYANPSEFADVQLVACAQIAAQTPNGVSCDLEGDDGTITLNLVDTSYDLTIHAATTGAVVGMEKIEAASDRCPTFVFIDEGQTEYLNSPTEEQYINALRPYVAP